MDDSDFGAIVWTGPMLGVQTGRVKNSMRQRATAPRRRPTTRTSRNQCGGKKPGMFDGITELIVPAEPAIDVAATAPLAAPALDSQSSVPGQHDIHLRSMTPRTKGIKKDASSAKLLADELRSRIGRQMLKNKPKKVSEDDKLDDEAASAAKKIALVAAKVPAWKKAARGPNPLAMAAMAARASLKSTKSSTEKRAPNPLALAAIGARASLKSTKGTLVKNAPKAAPKVAPRNAAVAPKSSKKAPPKVAPKSFQTVGPIATKSAKAPKLAAKEAEAAEKTNLPADETAATAKAARVFDKAAAVKAAEQLRLAAEAEAARLVEEKAADVLRVAEEERLASEAAATKELKEVLLAEEAAASRLAKEKAAAEAARVVEAEELRLTEEATASRIAEEKAATEAARVVEAEELRRTEEAAAARATEEATASRIAEEKAAAEAARVVEAEELRRTEGAAAARAAEEATASRIVEEKAAAEAARVVEAEELRRTEEATAFRLAEEKAAAEAARVVEAEAEELRRTEEAAAARATEEATASRLAEEKAAAEAARVVEAKELRLTEEAAAAKAAEVLRLAAEVTAAATAAADAARVVEKECLAAEATANKAAAEELRLAEEAEAARFAVKKERTAKLAQADAELDTHIEATVAAHEEEVIAQFNAVEKAEAEAARVVKDKASAESAEAAEEAKAMELQQLQNEADAAQAAAVEADRISVERRLAAESAISSLAADVVTMLVDKAAQNVVQEKLAEETAVAVTVAEERLMKSTAVTRLSVRANTYDVDAGNSLLGKLKQVADVMGIPMSQAITATSRHRITANKAVTDNAAIDAADAAAAAAAAANATLAEEEAELAMELAQIKEQLRLAENERHIEEQKLSSELARIAAEKEHFEHDLAAAKQATINEATRVAREQQRATEIAVAAEAAAEQAANDEAVATDQKRTAAAKKANEEKKVLAEQTRERRREKRLQAAEAKKLADQEAAAALAKTKAAHAEAAKIKAESNTRKVVSRLSKRLSSDGLPKPRAYGKKEDRTEENLMPGETDSEAESTKEIPAVVRALKNISSPSPSTAPVSRAANGRRSANSTPTEKPTEAVLRDVTDKTVLRESPKRKWKAAVQNISRVSGIAASFEAFGTVKAKTTSAVPAWKQELQRARKSRVSTVPVPTGSVPAPDKENGLQSVAGLPAWKVEWEQRKAVIRPSTSSGNHRSTASASTSVSAPADDATVPAWKREVLQRRSRKSLAPVM